MSTQHEYTIVAALLAKPGRHVFVTRSLLAEWFQVKQLGAWFRVLSARPMTMKSASEWITKKLTTTRHPKRLKLFEGMQGKLPQLTEHPEDADVDYAARQILHRHKRGTFLDHARWLIERLDDDDLKGAEKAVSTLRTEIAALTVGEHHPAPLDALTTAAVAQYDAVAEGGSSYIKTGLARIDEVIGGGRPGELWLWGGYAGEGKTTMSLNIAYTAWRSGKSVVWTPLEMSQVDVAQLLLCRHSASLCPSDPLVSRQLRDGTLTPEHSKLLRETAADIRRLRHETPFAVWPLPRNGSIEYVAHYLEGVARRRTVDMLVIDYLELLAPIERRRSAREELNDTLGAAKQLAEKYNDGRGLWLLSPHQINRAGYEKARDRKPSPHYVSSDLAESARAERDSDVVGWCLTTPKLEAYQQTLVGIAKSRHSASIPLGFRVHVNPASAYVGNIVDENEASPEPSMTNFDGAD